MRFDDVVVSLPVLVASLIVSTLSLVQFFIHPVTLSVTEIGFSCIQSDVAIVLDLASDLVVNLHMFPLSDPAIVLPRHVCTNNSCGSTEERPVGIHLVLWVKVDAHSVLAKGSIRIDTVQRDRAAFRGELRNISPFAASKSLEDEEQDEHEWKAFEEAEPR